MGDKIVVTGGAGFLGSYVVEKLEQQGHEVSIPRSTKYDLRRRADVYRMYEDFEPEAVIHLAAQCGGIGINQKKPASFLYDNLLMCAEMIDAALGRVRKFVQIGTVCSYPKDCPTPFREESLWDGFPETTNAGYGIAKKVAMLQCELYRTQYGLNAVSVIPVNLFGPRDNFNSFTSHVIPALIKKCVEAKKASQPSIDVWGTGSASREFLYVDDAADGIVAAYEKYEGATPVNLGSGEEITIRELVQKIKSVTGYAGEVRWDVSKPDGQPKRCLDVSKAKEFGFQAKTSLDKGLEKTVEWYLETQKCSTLTSG